MACSSVARGLASSGCGLGWSHHNEVPPARTPRRHTRRRIEALSLPSGRQPPIVGAAAAIAPSPSAIAPLSPQVWSPHGPSEDGHSSFDVLGLAQAMVDFTAVLPDEEILSQPPFMVGKGQRRIISLQERHQVIEALEAADCESQVSAGGSLANSLVGIARLARAHGTNLRVGMAGSVGGDNDGFLGQYFNSQLQSAGVSVVVDEDNAAHTGTVMVLTTPDAQRSFLSFFDSGSVWLTPRMRRAVTSAHVVVVEGYMLELPGAPTWLHEVLALAKASGAKVVLTAGDPSVVARHRATLESILQAGLVDVMFCNRDEAATLVNCAAGERRCSARQLAALLATYLSVAVVTDGKDGSCLAMAGAEDVHVIKPPELPREGGPVDVCGAGDAYAAGLLYCLISGYDLHMAGVFASQVSAAVICRHGASLEEEDAAKLVQQLPDTVMLSSAWAGLSSGLAA